MQNRSCAAYGGLHQLWSGLYREGQRPSVVTKAREVWSLAQDSGRPAGAGGRRLVCLPSRLRLLAKPSSPSAGATGF